MLLTKEIEMNIARRNKKYYTEKGYNCVVGKFIKIKVSDLNPNSHYTVKAQCRNCQNICEMQYEVYLRNIYSTEINEYFCIHCKHIKNRKLAEIRQAKGLLKRNDNFYWYFEENRIEELKKYIYKHGNIHNIDKNDLKLYSAITDYDGRAINLAEKAGLVIDEITNNKPYGYYDNLDNLIQDIEKFIDDYGRFPTQNEMANIINISSSHIYKHFDNMQELKKYMGYNDDCDLIDNKGDRNKSYYELYVANFLIEYGLKDSYKREQYPFKKYDSNIIYRSDFTLYTSDNKEVHVEVWGENGNESSPLYSYYKQKMKIKKSLYKKYSKEIILIDIFPKHLVGSYEKIHNNLFRIFSDYFNLDYKNIDYNTLISSKDFKDYELLIEIMKYSKDENYLPTKKELSIDDYGNNLLKIVEGKYGGLTYFYNKFDKKMRHKKNNFWNENKVFQCFDYMFGKYGKILSYTEYKSFKDPNLVGVFSYIQRNNGYIYYKIKYADYCLQNKRIVPQDIIKFIENAKQEK